MQTEPFIHVDGDIYLPQPLPKRLLGATLLAQNKEIGTHYYKRMLKDIVTSLRMPMFMKELKTVDSFESCNMGIFGGHNIAFIQEYCQEVFNFICQNNLNDNKSQNSYIDCNVFFEQVLFAMLAKARNENIESLFVSPVADNGYTIKDFCDLGSYESSKFFHLLGGHKRNRMVCNMLRRVFAKHYPDTLKRILQEAVLQKSHQIINMPLSFSDNDPWRIFRALVYYRRTGLLLDELIIMENNVLHSIKHMRRDDNIDSNYRLYINPYYMQFQVSNVDAMDEKKRIRMAGEVQSVPNVPLRTIGALPSLTGNEVEFMPINDMEIKIIKKIHAEKCSLRMLLDDIMSFYNFTTINESRGAFIHISQEIKSLIWNGIILIDIK